MPKKLIAVLLIMVTGSAVIVIILTMQHLNALPKSGAKGEKQESILVTDSVDNNPLTAYPDPHVTSLRDETALLYDGKPPETLSELEATVERHALQSVGASSLALGEENAILRLQIIRSDSGEVITAEGRWEFSLQQLSLPESKTVLEPGRKRQYRLWLSFGNPAGRPLVYYFLIANDYGDKRYDTAGSIIPPGVRYLLSGKTLDSKNEFYAEFNIPREIEPGTCITFNIPAGVGTHPNLRPKKRLEVKIDPDLKPPAKAEKWLAIYHLYSAYDRPTFNSNPLQGEFGKEDWTADLGPVKLGEAVTVTNPNRSVTWIYVEKVPGYNVQLPRDADFILKDHDDIREVTVAIPPALFTNGRQPKHLEVGAMHEDRFIPLARVALTERFLPKGAIANEDRPLAEVKIGWLPGTYNVIIKGSPYGSLSDEEINSLTLEQSMEMFRIPPRMLTLATGTLTIPDGSADNSKIKIENLELTDIGEYLKPLN